MVVCIETHNWTLFRDLEGAVLTGMLLSDPTVQGSKIDAEEGTEVLFELEVQDDFRQEAFFRHNRTDAHISS